MEEERVVDGRIKTIILPTPGRVAKGDLEIEETSRGGGQHQGEAHPERHRSMAMLFRLALGLRKMAGTVWCGEMLYRGLMAGTVERPKNWAT